MLIFALLAFPVHAEDWMVDGKDYHNVKVGTLDPDKVHITYDGGLGTVFLADLSPDLQKRFGYDAKAAKKQAEISASATEKSKAEWNAIRNSAVRLYGVVLQKVSGGYMIQTRESNPGYDNADFFGYYATQGGTPAPADSFVNPFGTLSTLRKDVTIFLASTRDMVDDDRVDFLVYPSGEGSYKTVLGAQSTVRTYAELPSLERRDGQWVGR